MNIVFLCRFFNPHIGGVEKHVFEISQILINKGHTVTIITEQYDNALEQKEIYKGITIYRIDTGHDSKYTIWKEMFSLRDIINKADVVHCHDVFYWYLPMRFFYPKKPVYTTFHGYESVPIRKGAVRMRKLAEKLSWGNICIGVYITKWYGTKPDFVTYGGVHVPTDKSKKTYKRESAVFMGRLDEQTGALTYAKTIKTIKRLYPNFTLTFIGDGKDRKKLEKDFSVLGFKKDPENFFTKYHYAFVSRYLSILEALAYKKLVFAVYDNPVKRDALKMTPYSNWIVYATNEKELTEKILYYLSHPEEEKRMIEKGYAWVKNQSWENVSDIYLKLWKKSIPSGNRGGKSI